MNMERLTLLPSVILLAACGVQTDPTTAELEPPNSEESESPPTDTPEPTPTTDPFPNPELRVVGDEEVV